MGVQKNTIKPLSNQQVSEYSKSIASSVVIEEEGEEEKKKEVERSWLSKKSRSVFLHLTTSMFLATMLSVVMCVAWIITYFLINDDNIKTIRKANMNEMYTSLKNIVDAPQIVGKSIASAMKNNMYGAQSSFLGHKNFLQDIIRSNLNNFPAGLQCHFVSSNVTFGIKKDPSPERNVFQVFYVWHSETYTEQRPNNNTNSLFYYDYANWEEGILDTSAPAKEIPGFKSGFDAGSRFLATLEPGPKYRYVPAILESCPAKGIRCSHVSIFASQPYDSHLDGYIAAVIQVGYFGKLLSNIASQGVTSLVIERETGHVVGTSLQGIDLYSWNEEENKHIILSADELGSIEIRHAVDQLQALYGQTYEKMPSNNTVQLSMNEGSHVNFVDAQILSSPGQDLVLIQIVNIWQYIGTATIVGICLSVFCVIAVILSIIGGCITAYVIYKPLQDFVNNLKGITDGLDLDAMKLGKRPFFTEFDQLYITFQFLVEKLKFYRTFLPDHILKQVEGNKANLAVVDNDKSTAEPSTLASTNYDDSNMSHPSGGSMGSTASIHRQALTSGLTYDVASFLCVHIDFKHKNNVIMNMRTFSELLHKTISLSSVRHGHLEHFSDNQIIIGFNTITKSKNHIYAAADVAIKIQNAFSKKMSKSVPFQFGIGLSSSRCYMGTIGSKEKRSWKSIGPALERVHILSQHAFKLRVGILMDQDCEAVVPSTDFQYRLADLLLLPSKVTFKAFHLVSKVVNKNDEWIYELRNQESSSWANLYNEAIQALKDDEFDRASTSMESFLDNNANDYLGKNMNLLIQTLYQSNMSLDDYIEQQTPSRFSLGAHYVSLLSQHQFIDDE